MTSHQVYRTGNVALLSLMRQLKGWPMAAIGQHPPTHEFSITVPADLPYAEMQSPMAMLVQRLKEANCHAIGAPPMVDQSGCVLTDPSGLSLRATPSPAGMVSIDVRAFASVRVETIRALLLTLNGGVTVMDVPPTDLGGPPPHIHRAREDFRPWAFLVQPLVEARAHIVFTRKQLIAQRGPIALVLYEEEA